MIVKRQQLLLRLNIEEGADDPDEIARNLAFLLNKIDEDQPGLFSRGFTCEVDNGR
jgi:hypothetical protein